MAEEKTKKPAPKKAAAKKAPATKKTSTPKSTKSATTNKTKDDSAKDAAPKITVESLAASKTESAVSPAVTGSNSTPMILGAVIGGLFILVLLIVGVVALAGGGSADDEGIDIPNGWEKYEDDDFSFGYPEDEGWSVDESFGSITVSKSENDDEDESGFNIGSFTDVSVSFDVSDIEEENDELEFSVDDLRNQKCSDLEDEFRNQLGAVEEEGLEFDFRVDKAEINELKGCEIRMSFDFLSISTNSIMYMLVKDGDDENGYSIQITAPDLDGDDYETALDIARSFRAE